MGAVGMRGDVPGLDEVVERVANALPIDDGDDRPPCDDDSDATDLLDRSRIRRRRDGADDPKRTEVDQSQSRLGVARDQRVWRRRCSGSPREARTAPRRNATNSRRFTGLSTSQWCVEVRELPACRIRARIRAAGTSTAPICT
jgi:hypothetical protein